MLTVQDIQAKQFHVRFRGFDQGEVDEFLEQVAAALQGANYENSILKEQVAAAERKVAAFKQQEKSSMNAILSAQKVADEMKEKARAEAKALLSKARQEARELEESAGREISGLEREVDQLRAKKSQVREELRLVLESYLSQLDRDQAAPSTAAAGTIVFGGPASSAPIPAAPPAMDDDLYQQIEFSDDMLTPAMDKGGPVRPAPPAVDSAATEEEQTMPYLDDDMVFTLEDPLDQEEPDNRATLAGEELLLSGQGELQGGENDRLVIDDDLTGDGPGSRLTSDEDELHLLDQDDLLGDGPELNLSLDDDEQTPKP